MKLTDTQLVLLSAASQREDEFFVRPSSMNATAANAAVAALHRKGLAEEVATVRDQPHWHIDESRGPIGYRITASGLAALGLAPDDGGGTVEPEPEPESDDERQPSARSTTTRSGTKPALVLALVGRDDGATIGDLTGATGWLPHSVRAAISGLRKGGVRISRSTDERGTVYRLEASTIAGPESRS